MSQQASRATRSQSVPVFALYGEAEERSSAEFLHLEPLSARGESLGWEISRHTHRGLFQAVFLFDLAGEAILDNQGVPANAPCAVLVPPGVVHAFHFEPGVEGYVLTLAALWAGPAGQAGARFPLEGLMEQAGVVDLGEDCESCRALLGELARELRDRRPGHAAMSEWLAAAVLMLLARRRAVAQATAPAGDARGATFARFRALVEAHYAERWPASRYAQALAITQSRLDRTCRAASGRSAFEIVQDRVLLEARRKLVHVAAPVSALAYELGFEDPAYFCRFFKRRVGSTPTQWRRAQRDRLAGLPGGDPK